MILPMTTSDPHYDVFISYSHADTDWVWEWLRPRLEAAGLHLCLDRRDFDVAVPSLENMERAVDHSRHTLLVLTPAWVDSEWTAFEALLTQTVDPAARQRRLIPLLLQPCQPPRRIQMLTYADFTRRDTWDAEFPRVIAAIRGELHLPELGPPLHQQPSQGHEQRNRQAILEKVHTVSDGVPPDWEMHRREGRAARQRGKLSLGLVVCIFLAFILWTELWPTQQIDGDELRQLLYRHCWIGYDPLDFNPTVPSQLSDQAIQRDLRWIRMAGFTGVVTYGSGGMLARIPELAKQAGLAVIMGVWNAANGAEIKAAARQHRFVDAYCVGHNGLGRPYTAVNLKRAVVHLRRRTHRPVTTSEETRVYDLSLAQLGDWLFPDAHLSLRTTPTAPETIDVQRDIERFMIAARNMTTMAKELGRPLMFKTVLYPWKEAQGASLETQRQFFAALRDSVRSPGDGLPINVAFMVHGAFDSPWKKGYPFYSWDRYTGLLESDGRPRPAAQELARQCP